MYVCTCRRVRRNVGSRSSDGPATLGFRRLGSGLCDLLYHMYTYLPIHLYIHTVGTYITYLGTQQEQRQQQRQQRTYTRTWAHTQSAVHSKKAPSQLPPTNFPLFSLIQISHPNRLSYKPSLRSTSLHNRTTVSTSSSMDIHCNSQVTFKQPSIIQAQLSQFVIVRFDSPKDSLEVISYRVFFFLINIGQELEALCSYLQA